MKLVSHSVLGNGNYSRGGSYMARKVKYVANKKEVKLIIKALEIVKLSYKKLNNHKEVQQFNQLLDKIYSTEEKSVKNG